ncbi:MAG: endo-1,4-beta-xylanase [Acidobacteria bacterium]|nr:endo-1,4-beta-xylanase [Acidobacteriota bacterium]MBI3658812.1 endo-1,4-beta-xylanase [Acidobacteriota bacterium]
MRKYLRWVFWLTIIFWAGAPAPRAQVDMWGINDVPMDRFAYAMDHGLGWARIEPKWRDTEPQPGMYDFAAFDRVVEEANRLGLGLVASIGIGYSGNMPAWLRARGGIGDPQYTDYLADYLYALVRRYAGKIAFYQVENELNHIGLEQFFLTRRREGQWTDALVREVLEKAVDAVHRADPEARIIINVEADNPNWWRFLSKVTREWLIDYDVIGIDAYPNYVLPAPELGAIIGRSVARAGRDFKKPVIITEAGYSTWSLFHTETNQAIYMQFAVQAAMQSGAIGFFYYSFRDSPGPSFAEVELHFGLHRLDGSPKPAWEEYGRLIAEASP